MKPLDFIGAIEAAYDRSADDAAWLARLVTLVRPALGSQTAATAYFFDLRTLGEREAPPVGKTVTVGEDGYGRDDYRRMHAAGREASGRSLRVVYECEMLTLLSRVVGPDVAAKSFERAGMAGEDAIGLRANATSETGVLFTTPVPRGHRIRGGPLLKRFASHVGAALRLRRTERALSPESAAAVLTPRGRIEHANETASAAGRALTSAAQDVDRARGKLRRLDVDAASSLWRALVQGEWSLVEWVDHDGKRFLLAEENRVAADARKRLTDRELQVVACAAMGHANKLIAYDLGLSPGTVAVLLGRAARKLGVTGRVALIRAFRELGG